MNPNYLWVLLSLKYFPSKAGPPYFCFPFLILICWRTRAGWSFHLLTIKKKKQTTKKTKTYLILKKMLRSDIIGPKGHPDCRQPSWREYGLLQSDALLGRQVFWNIKVNFGWLLGRSHPSSRDSGVCLFYLYCNIVASQCCVSFCCTMTFPLDLPLTLPPHSSPLGHHRAWNNLCYRAASH